MEFNFSHPMTSYEFIAIIISIVALILPFIQKIYCYFFKNIKLKFIPNGQVKLLFNQSGGYLRLYGVYESENKQSIIRNITVKVNRVNDNTIFTFTWSSFISPVTQNFSNNNFIEAIEIAHPIIIAKDSLFPAFIEFSDPSASSQTAIYNCLEPLVNQIPTIGVKTNSFEDACKIYTKNQLYINAKNIINNEFIWKTGKYNLEIEVEYNSKKKSFFYNFEISEHEYKQLQNNIDEAIICNLKKSFCLSLNFYTANLALHEKKII